MMEQTYVQSSRSSTLMMMHTVAAGRIEAELVRYSRWSSVCDAAWSIAKVVESVLSRCFGARLGIPDT
jgi:hypothetical protein